MGINKNKLKQDIFLSLDILDSLVPMRFVTAVAEQDKEGDLLERVSRELWKRMWCTHQDITQPASLIEVSYSQPKIKKLNQINKKTHWYSVIILNQWFSNLSWTRSPAHFFYVSLYLTHPYRTVSTNELLS